MEILGKLHNDDHSIAVPGFCDDIDHLTPDERNELAKTDISENDLMSSTGAPAVWGESAFTVRESISARPTLEINGLVNGWTGAGQKRIIPVTVLAKVSCRLVGTQDPDKIYDRVKQYIESIALPTVKVRVDLLSTSGPALIDYNIPETQTVSRVYEMARGAKPIFIRGGRSIPVVAEITYLMHIPVVMMGYALDDDGFHGPNDRFSIEMSQRSIETAIVYLDELG
ncbi:MAG: peptidase dimerization domain-containing protein, partial [Thermomicrobiales bacterium]